MSAFPVTIFHNPACGTSRNTLAAIRAAGIEPVVVDYLKAGWSAQELRALLDAMGKTPRQILRLRGTPADELGLQRASDEEILQAMTRHPILVERPIVRSPKGVRLCRPSETVAQLLPDADS